MIPAVYRSVNPCLPIRRFTTLLFGDIFVSDARAGNTVYQEVAMNLKELRLEKGMTQRDVAGAIGCSAKAYSDYERGAREPSIEVFLRLADVFGVTMDALLGRPQSEGIVLSGHEIELVNASREADARARKDALLLLQSHARGQDKKGRPG